MPVKELYDEHVLWGELKNKQSKSGSDENCSRLKRLRRVMERRLPVKNVISGYRKNQECIMH